ncbi:MAG: hypothetical protein KDC70_01650 [Saprospiraceae bacterium]|nr:hypothetical protein [Saprospiraceae bacterium]
MKKTSLLLMFLLAFLTLPAQALYEELPSMPEPVSNNAVTAAIANGAMYVYSFCGLDSSKLWSGIHLKAWRMNMSSGIWEALPPVPDPEGGKIAAAASTVKNSIYVIGGYHVAQNGSETSSDKVHRFDPASNSWLSDGAPLPKAIDDHVQAVWRDSLIYVITGWSNITNVPDVQIYNPAGNVWLDGTDVPNNVNYKVFGASGVIIGDTIYYCGGAAAGINFPASSFFRIGIIDPGNPAQINWSGFSSADAKGYRMAAATQNSTAVWIGGSDVTYNYNGIAYNGSGGVPALARRKLYQPATGTLVNENTNALPAIMDLRGAAQIDLTRFVTAGGMENGQKVSNRVFLYSPDGSVGAESPADPAVFSIYPNPVADNLSIDCDGSMAVQVILYDVYGRTGTSVSGTCPLTLPVTQLASGIYRLQVLSAERQVWSGKILIAR